MSEALVLVHARRVEAPFKDVLAWAQSKQHPSEVRASYIMDGNRIEGISVPGMSALYGGYRSWATRGEWILVFDGGPTFWCSDEVARRFVSAKEEE